MSLLNMIKLHSEKTEWLVFEFYQFSSKTLLVVITNHNEELLGCIKWHAPYRKYAFLPNQDTVFDDKCLNSIIDKMNTMNREHRENRKNER